ncbi:MAG: prepilin-type N-terminal cleavage/methylation domain-containing protein [Candidatus Margulisiibacteriota bacterium]|jgi:type II secretion system protein G
MQKGFTLIELLIVIAIIGTLSTLMLPNFIGAQDKAKETAVRAVALSLQNALENYNIDNGIYPAGNNLGAAQLYQALSAGNYLRRPIVNPFTGQAYTAGDSSGKVVYSYDSAEGQYQLTAYKRDGSSVLMVASNL